MKEVTGNFATTIHALLKWNLETNTFGKNAVDPLLADVLIIDEFSMVDGWLMAQLALASGYVRKILFIGDEDQLPSVACGSVLRDLIASKRFKTVRLQHIYRQKEGSDVIQLAQHIKAGHFDESMCKNDVRFFGAKPYDVKDLILRIVDEAMMKGYRIQDIQVLAAKYSGPAGIDALNHALQKLCNPSEKRKRELQVGYRLYREGDKILQLKNQPTDDVYNGDIGILVEIVYASEDENNQNRMIVDFDGIIVEYSPEWFINITHAYCISVHKAQGSEYPIVIMAAIMEYGQMLQRRLMYTGITRASRSLILVGQKTAFEKAVSTVDKDTRKTFLTQRLLDELT
jgi:exodeoxyribonuclease V alpha subunit